MSDFVRCIRRINFVEHGLYILALEHAMKLILSSYVHIFKYCYAYCDTASCRSLYFQAHHISALTHVNIK